MMRGRAGRRAVAWMVVASLSAIGLTACRAERSKDLSQVPRPSSTTTAPPAAASGKAYCTAALAFATVPPPEIDDAAPAAEQATLVQQYATGTLKPAADDLVADAPEEVNDDVNVVAAAVEALVASGDADAYDNDTVDLAKARLHQYDLAHCGFKSQEVAMADYSFREIDAVAAGPVSFDVTNSGKEYHELAVIMKRPGTKQSFDEILALDDQAAQDRLATYVGGVDPVAPGDTGYAVLDLKPGAYLMACFLSVGSTPDRFESGAEIDGPPHVARGMKREFEVD